MLLWKQVKTWDIYEGVGELHAGIYMTAWGDQTSTGFKIIKIGISVVCYSCWMG